LSVTFDLVKRYDIVFSRFKQMNFGGNDVFLML